MSTYSYFKRNKVMQDLCKCSFKAVFVSSSSPHCSFIKVQRISDINQCQVSLGTRKKQLPCNQLESLIKAGYKKNWGKDLEANESFRDYRHLFAMQLQQKKGSQCSGLSISSLSAGRREEFPFLRHFCVQSLISQLYLHQTWKLCFPKAQGIHFQETPGLDLPSDKHANHLTKRTSI